MWGILITGRIFKENTLIGASIEADNVITNSSMKNTIMAKGPDGIKDSILAARPLEGSRVLAGKNMGARMSADLAVTEKKDTDRTGLTVFRL